MDYTLPIIVGIVVILLLIILYIAVRVVNEYARLVVFRFGRTGEGQVQAVRASCSLPDRRPAGLGGPA